MEKPQTYLDHTGADFVPCGQLQLVFKAWLSHGPGHDEMMSFLVGPDTDNTHDVLWMESDWAEEVSAIAWLPCGLLAGDELYGSLLTAYWEREKEENELDEPNFTEVLKTPGAALNAKQIHELAQQVWPQA